MFALSHAVCGMESVRALAELLVELRSAMATPLEPNNTAALESLISETLAQVPLMCTQVYRGVARSLLPLEQVTTALRNRSWVPKEPSSQHNTYVDTLLQMLQQLNGSLVNLSLPTAVHVTVLEEAVSHIAQQLVDAYAHVKKCNDEGRALMARDVKVLQAALDNLLRRSMLPQSKLSLSHAEHYVLALALPPDQLVGWARTHKGYSIKHLSALVMTVGLGAALKKKEQQELVAGLQDVCAQHARE